MAASSSPSTHPTPHVSPFSTLISPSRSSLPLMPHPLPIPPPKPLSALHNTAGSTPSSTPLTESRLHLHRHLHLHPQLHAPRTLSLHTRTRARALLMSCRASIFIRMTECATSLPFIERVLRMCTVYLHLSEPYGGNVCGGKRRMFSFSTRTGCAVLMKSGLVFSPQLFRGCSGSGCVFLSVRVDWTWVCA